MEGIRISGYQLEKLYRMVQCADEYKDIMREVDEKTKTTNSELLVYTRAETRSKVLHDVICTLCVEDLYNDWNKKN